MPAGFCGSFQVVSQASSQATWPKSAANIGVTTRRHVMFAQAADRNTSILGNIEDQDIGSRSGCYRCYDSLRFRIRLASRSMVASAGEAGYFKHLGERSSIAHIMLEKSDRPEVLTIERLLNVLKRARVSTLRRPIDKTRYTTEALAQVK